MGATMPICRIIFATVMLLSAAINAPAGAQATDVRFVLDFLLQGQQSAFVLGRERGYYAAQKVNLVAFDPGRGGADSIIKVASGTHDIGFGDLSALIEFNARNAGKELLAVLLVYDQAPLSLISLKKAGIEAGRPHGAQGRRTDGRRNLPSVQRVRAREWVDPGRVQWSTCNLNPRAHAHSRRDRFRGGLGR